MQLFPFPVPFPPFPRQKPKYYEDGLRLIDVGESRDDGQRRTQYVNPLLPFPSSPRFRTRFFFALKPFHASLSPDHTASAAAGSSATQPATSATPAATAAATATSKPAAVAPPPTAANAASVGTGGDASANSPSSAHPPRIPPPLSPATPVPSLTHAKSRTEKKDLGPLSQEDWAATIRSALKGGAVKPSQTPTGPPADFKEDIELELQKEVAEISRLQEILYAQNKYSLLVVLQALDAGGKDSLIKAVFSGVNPQGVCVTSFKAPSKEELGYVLSFQLFR